VPLDYQTYAFTAQCAHFGSTIRGGTGEFCPDCGVTRAEMAVFLIRAFP